MVNPPATETIDVAKGNWYYTPTKDFADLTALRTLPTVDVKVSARSQRKGTEDETRVTVENPGQTLAFFLHLQIKQVSGGEEILPVIWEDNYFSLLPGERREISATYAADLVRGPSPMVEIAGWNTVAKSTPIIR